MACYHSKIGAVELCLNHLVDGRGEYVVVDMTAGADSFASGLFTRFDLTFLVAEPTRKGVGVYRQYRDYAAGLRRRRSPSSATRCRDRRTWTSCATQVGDDLLAWVGHSAGVRAMEQGRPFTLGDLEPAQPRPPWRRSGRLDAQPRDWARYTRQAAEFHLRNARGLGQRRAGEDLAAQIDPRVRLRALATRLSPFGSMEGSEAHLASNQSPSRGGRSMSLTVPNDLLDQARAGEVDDAAFVACVRDSLPYAWSVISELVEHRDRTGAEFADNQVPPPDEEARGQLLRALASDAMRGAPGAPLRGETRLPELPPGRRVRPVGPRLPREFVTARGADAQPEARAGRGALAEPSVQATHRAGKVAVRSPAAQAAPRRPAGGCSPGSAGGLRAFHHEDEMLDPGRP